VKKSLQQFLNQKVKIVKDDGFVIWGEIIAIYDDCIEFFTDGRKIVLSFDRIKEVVPLNRRGGLNDT
jgi:hypothetical protein